MICPGCGAENPDYAEYCSLCCHRFAGQAPVADSGAPAEAVSPVDSMGAASTEYPEQPAGPPVGPDAVTPFAAAPAYDVPPPPAAGPGVYQPSPSEWGPHAYDPSTYGAPPPPVSTAKKGWASSAPSKVLMLTVAVLFFALGWFATDWYLTKREVAYVSAQSNISFRYPSGWKKVGAKEIGNLGGASGLPVNYEVVLADSKGSSSKYFMGVASAEATPDMWENAKQNVNKMFGPGGGSQQTLSASTSISGSTVTPTTVAGSDALDVKMKVSTTGVDMEGRLAYVYNGTRIYVIVFVSSGDSNKTQGQVQNVIDSVIFKK